MKTRGKILVKIRKNKQENIQEPIEKDHILEWINVENIEEKMYVKAQGWAVNYFLKNNMHKTVR